MAIGLYFTPANMTESVYDECIAQLKKAGAAHPPGRTYHACFVDRGKVQVFDVWTSRAQFDTFGQVLMPILQGLGVDPGQPMVSEIHNIIVPPAKAKTAAPVKAKAAKPKARAKKPVAKKKGRRK